jgi:4-amino-4-deoxychorismate lyase
MPLLLETIRLEPKTMQLPLLPYHIRRMQRSQLHFWNIFSNQNLQKIILDTFTSQNTTSLLATEIVRCRVLYDMKIQQIEFFPYEVQILDSLELIEATDLNYALKFANRDELNSLKNNSEASDVLIVKNGLITDISYANVAFFNGNQWLTPKTPLLKGTKRQQFIEQGKIIETDIKITDLQHFNAIKTFNAMMEKIYYFQIKGENRLILQTT